VPKSVAPNIRNRSYTIAAEVDIVTKDASGVLFSQGSRFGGHALYVRDGKLAYVYNFVGELVQIVESEEMIPTGPDVLSASFEREGTSMPARGTLTLHVRDRAVGSGSIPTQPGKFGLGGGGLVVDARDLSRSPTTRASARGPSWVAPSSAW
jgi:arylsulfatase